MLLTKGSVYKRTRKFPVKWAKEGASGHTAVIIFLKSAFKYFEI